MVNIKINLLYVSSRSLVHIYTRYGDNRKDIGALCNESLSYYDYMASVVD